MKPNLFFGVTLVVGTILTLLGNAFHPVLPVFDVAAYAAGAGGLTWAVIHLLLLAGIILVSIGFLQVYAVLRQRGESVYSVVGLFTVLLSGVLWSVVFVLDGFVGPRLAAQYLSATPANQPALAALLDYNLSIALNLLVLAFILDGIGVGFIGAALWRANLYPKALGATGPVIGAVILVGYAVGLFGAYFVGNTIFTIAAAVLLVWILVLGVFLLRGEPSHPRATPSS